MRKYSSLFWYVALFVISFLADRATKFFVLRQARDFGFCSLLYKVNKCISFDLVFNRGMSWGIFASENNFVFLLVSMCITFITVIILVYAYMRFRSGDIIIGEVFVIAGSVSNIIDRIVYGGVVDFIAISFGNWFWPVFNVADMFIVIGVCIMLLTVWYKK